MEEFRDYGMRAYKAPLSLRIKNFFMLHPMLVAFLFAVIISFIMGGCQKVNAADADYTDVFWADVQEEMSNI